MAVNHKSKQYLIAITKVLVLVITFGYIFYRLQSNPDLDFISFVHSIYSKGSFAGYSFLFFLLLTSINWWLEILKWKSLASTIQKMDFKTALSQTLASLTVSLATPNRIGEYGAKAVFYNREDRKKVMLLNFFSNAAQLTTTLLFGLIGIFSFLWKYRVSYSKEALSLLGIGLISLIVFGYFIKEIELWLKNFSIANIFRFFKKLPYFLKLKVVLFSVLRYLCFSSMFYGLLLFFGAQISFSNAMILIYTMYLLVSIVPTVFIFDVVVRGGVAVWLFSFVGLAELTVLSTVLAMWILNFVLPALLGSFFVITYQPIRR